MALLDDFKARFPEFDTATVEAFIPRLEAVWPCFYGGTYGSGCDSEIILQLLAHLITVESANGSQTVQAIASKAVGNVSLSYAAMPSTSSARMLWFSGTKYGAAYLRLTRKRQGGIFV